MKLTVHIPLLAVVQVEASGPDAAKILANRMVMTDLKYTTHEYKFDGEAVVGDAPTTRLVPPKRTR